MLLLLLLLLLHGALINLGMTVLGRDTNKYFTHQEFSQIYCSERSGTPTGETQFKLSSR